LFPRIKKELGGRKFENVKNLAWAVQAMSDSIPKDEYYKAFRSWQKRLKRCIEVGGECFEIIMYVFREIKSLSKLF